MFEFCILNPAVMDNSFRGQSWVGCVPLITCPLCSCAVYSAGRPLSPVEGQKKEVTKYFISQVKHTSLHQSKERERETEKQITVTNVQSA